MGFRGLLNLQLLNLIKQFFSQLGSTVGFLFTLGPGVNYGNRVGQVTLLPATELEHDIFSQKNPNFPFLMDLSVEFKVNTHPKNPSFALLQQASLLEPQCRFFLSSKPLSVSYQIAVFSTTLFH